METVKEWYLKGIEEISAYNLGVKSGKLYEYNRKKHPKKNPFETGTSRCKWEQGFKEGREVFLINIHRYYAGMN